MMIRVQYARGPDGNGLKKTDIRMSKNADAVSDKSRS